MISVPGSIGWAGAAGGGDCGAAGGTWTGVAVAGTGAETGVAVRSGGNWSYSSGGRPGTFSSLPPRLFD